MRKTRARDGAICLSSFICQVPELKLRGKLKANKERVATARPGAPKNKKQKLIEASRRTLTSSCLTTMNHSSNPL